MSKNDLKVSQIIKLPKHWPKMSNKCSQVCRKHINAAMKKSVCHKSECRENKVKERTMRNDEIYHLNKHESLLAPTLELFVKFKGQRTWFQMKG